MYIATDGTGNVVNETAGCGIVIEDMDESEDINDYISDLIQKMKGHVSDELLSNYGDVRNIIEWDKQLMIMKENVLEFPVNGIAMMEVANRKIIQKMSQESQHRCYSFEVPRGTVEDLSFDGERVHGFSGDLKPTNNRGELLAVIVALMLCKGRKNLKIITDSTYVINVTNPSFTHRMTHQQIRKFKTNGDLICEFLKVRDEVEFEFIKVKSHISKKDKVRLSENELHMTNLNEIADELAGRWK